MYTVAVDLAIKKYLESMHHGKKNQAISGLAMDFYLLFWGGKNP